MADKHCEILSYVQSSVTEPFPNMPVRNTIPKCLEYWAERQGPKEAYVFVNESGRKSVTWQEMYSNSRVVANAMIKLGVKKDDYVVLYLRDSPEWLYVVYGAIMAGARPVPFYYVDKSWENVRQAMEHLKTCSMLVLESYEDTESIENVLGDVDINGRVWCERFPYLKSFVHHDERETVKGSKLVGTPLKCLLSDSDSDVSLPNVSENDIAVCSLSSGSTGPPKILSFTHKAFILANIPRFLNYENFIADEDIVYFNDRPFSWTAGFPKNSVYGFCRVTFTMDVNPSSTTLRRKNVIETISTERCNNVLMMSSALPQFIGAELPENWPVKIVIIGGRLSDQMFSLLGTFTTAFHIKYVSSELKKVAGYFVRHRDEYKPYCAGTLVRSIPNEVK